MTEEAKERTEDAQDYPRVAQAVRDFIFEKHRLPQVNDIVEITGIKRQRCNEVVDKLVAQKELYVVFEGATLPRIVVPYDMMQGMLMTQKKPDWLSSYGFSEKAEISKKIEDLQREAIQYDQFERLLYATDIPLEEAIAYTLDWLDFDNVFHYKDDTDNPDVTFEYDGVKVLLEAQGTTKQGNKDKIAQLNGWIQRELSEGAEASKLTGLFVVNHFRETEPSKRGDPLTPKAKEFLLYYSRLGFFTTTFLFDIVKRVASSTLSKDDARKLVWEGEKVK